MARFLAIKAISLALILQACSSETTVEKPEPFSSIPKGEEIVKANNEFAFSLFKEIADEETEANFMISPVSASLALGMVYNGAANETQQAFANTFNYGDATIEETNQINKSIIDNLTYSGSGARFDVANSLWIRNTFPVNEQFIGLNKNYYYAEVQNLDFDDPNSLKTINNWVSNKTNNKIPKILNTISPDAVLYAINALYFKGDWKHRFDSSNSKELPFYPDNSSFQSVTMMHQQENFEYFSNEEFSSVVLPYKEDQFNMVLLLPNENKNTEDIISSLNWESWQNWQQNYSVAKIALTLPKFTFSYEKLFNEALSDLGLGIAFTDEADFSGISDVPTKISFVLQKAFIDVNEKGTEAAAATFVAIGVTSVPLVTEMNFNKPFLFVITEKNTGSICFIGKVGMPEYE
jgi:serpin B